MGKGEIAYDERGLPIMLEVGKDAPTRSGNSRHDVRTGRFGSKGGRQENGGPPKDGGEDQADVGEGLWRDAVRTVAREFESFSPQDVERWLKGRTSRDIRPDELQQFIREVQDQQIDDLVDILDAAESKGSTARRKVRIVAPKGYTRKTVNGLSDDELRVVAQRLRARGWSSEQVLKRVPEGKREAIKGIV